MTIYSALTGYKILRTPDDHAYISAGIYIADGDPGTRGTLSTMYWPDVGLYLLGVIGSDPDDITLPQWDDLSGLPPITPLVKVNIELRRDVFAATTIVTFKYGKMVAGVFEFIGEIIVDTAIYVDETFHFEFELTEADFGSGYSNLGDFRVEIWGEQVVQDGEARLEIFSIDIEDNVAEIIEPVGLTEIFGLPPKDHIWHAQNEPSDVDNAYDWNNSSGKSFPNSVSYTKIDSVLISDWGTTEILCTFGADSTLDVKNPAWPNFTRSLSVVLHLDYARGGSGDYQIGVEFGTIDGSGNWIHINELVYIGSSSEARWEKTISLIPEDFGGSEFPELHRLRIRLKTIAGTETGVYLYLYAMYLTVETDEYIRVKPTGIYDLGGVWTDTNRILDGREDTYAFATNLSTYDNELQDTYSLMVGGTGPLVVDAAWESFPSVYFTKIFKYFISSSSYDGDDIHAIVDCGVYIDNEIVRGGTWFRETTGFGIDYQPGDGFYKDVNSDISKGRFLLDGNVVKGSDGKEFRIHYAYWDFYIEGDPPIIEDPGDIISLLALSGITTVQLSSLIPGATIISPSLQNVISSIESFTLIFTDVIIPVDILDLPLIIPTIRSANLTSVILSLLSQIVGITPAQILAGETIAITSAATSVFSAQPVTQSYSGLASVSLNLTSIDSSTNLQIALGTTHLEFNTPIIDSDLKNLSALTGPITVDFLTHVLTSENRITVIPGTAELEISILHTPSGILNIKSVCLLNKIFLKNLNLVSDLKLVSVKAVRMYSRCEFIHEEVLKNNSREIIEMIERNEISVNTHDEKTLTFEYKP